MNCGFGSGKYWRATSSTITPRYAATLAAFTLIGGALAVLVPGQVGDIMKNVVELAKTVAGQRGTNGNE
jgi:hypothetical protein